MPPTIHRIRLDAEGIKNSIFTTTPTININVTASGQPVDIAYSNDGSTFSAFEPFQENLFSFDITTLGGNSDLGRHTVFVKARDASLNEVVGSQDIFLGQVPVAEVEQLISDVSTVQIKYRLFDCDETINDIVSVEYSETGAFSGEEANATPVSTDNAHTGTVGLLGNRTGVQQTFVWNFDNDVGKENKTIFIRTKAKNPARTGDLFIFGPFNVLLRDVPAPGFKVDAGDQITLKVHYADKNGNSFDPDTVQITEILDSEETDVLGGPQTLVPTSTGNYEFNFTPSATGPFGVYTYTFVATVGGIPKEKTLSFDVKNPIAAKASCPSTPDSIVLSGQIEDVDGKPLEDLEIKFYPSNIEDVESIKVDSISDKPITVTTDDCGKFEVELIKNKAYAVVMPTLNYRKIFKAPNKDAEEFKNIITIDLPGGPRDEFGNPTGDIFDDLTELQPKKC